MRTNGWRWLGLWSGLSLGSAGCLISGYDERRAQVDDAAQRPGEPTPAGNDAGVPFDIDASAGELDAAGPSLMDAQLDPPDDDDGGRSDVEEWCATHPCGDVKQCAGPDCDLLCSAQSNFAADAGRGAVDCTFDCDGADRCDTACTSGLDCQTSCLGAERCSNHCKEGARCSVYCADARCGGTCERDSSCAFLCPPGGCGEVVCKAGARCAIRCGGNNVPNTNDTSCKFTTCENGQPQRCGNGRTVVCGRPCPMR